MNSLQYDIIFSIIDKLNIENTKNLILVNHEMYNFRHTIKDKIALKHLKKKNWLIMKKGVREYQIIRFTEKFIDELLESVLRSFQTI